MRTLSMLCLAACGLGFAAAEPINQGDRNRALSDLHATRKMFLDSIAGLSPEQWNYKPSPEQWSVAETAEHIALSEEMIFGMITKKIMAAPADASKRAEINIKDEEVLERVRSREKKATAPEQLKPAKKWADAESLAAAFKQSREKTLEYVRTTQDDLRSHVTPHPAFGPIDAYQWLLLLSGHTQRHVDQIREVKSSPGYPKR
jgi:uncharacterized damage-inducible protein DinB